MIRLYTTLISVFVLLIIPSIVFSQNNETSKTKTLTGKVTDIDGNVYQTIKIGDQWWMMENLKVSRYRNGDAITNVTQSAKWTKLSTGAYCSYDNLEKNAGIYGHLYNWYAVNDSRNIAPKGWHVPTDEDWKALEIYLGLSRPEADKEHFRGTIEGGKLKEAGISHWKSPNSRATNKSGFSALPGGLHNSGNYGPGKYARLGEQAWFWSASEAENQRAWTRRMRYNNSTIHRTAESRQIGISVRCIKNK